MRSEHILEFHLAGRISVQRCCPQFIGIGIVGLMRLCPFGSELRILALALLS